MLTYENYVITKEVKFSYRTDWKERCNNPGQKLTHLLVLTKDEGKIFRQNGYSQIFGKY